jgi:ceramide glucosyltransferase
VRWNRLRRAGFPFAYAGEIFSGTLVPFACGAALTVAGLLSPISLAAYIVAWYGLEAALTAAAALPFSPRMPAAWILRDLLMPVLWILGWAGSRIEWRGAALSVSPRSGQRAGK